MRNDLHGAAAVIAPALFLQDGPVNLTRGHIGVFVQIFIDETLIMSKIQICLGAVFGNKHLAVLDRVHGSRINIDVGIKFLHGYFVTARL